MPQRLLNMDWQMLTLNAASGSALVANALSESSTTLAVGFLIITIGVLNLAKAYATVKQSKKEQQ